MSTGGASSEDRNLQGVDQKTEVTRLCSKDAVQDSRARGPEEVVLTRRKG